MKTITLEMLREGIIGNDLSFETPFGRRNLFYADYTASGRGLKLIEEKMIKIQEMYANSHTEDDFSGKTTTVLLHLAEEKIKQLVNAGEHGKIVAIGSGATGALKRLQEILGVYIPPVTKEIIYGSFHDSDCNVCSILSVMKNRMPVVFVGPYEHHTNEVMWRESFAEVVVIKLGSDGQIDLKDLENKLNDPKYKFRKKLVSMSAGSNITGLKTKVYDIAKSSHKFGAYVIFDFAAIAPYTEINMNYDEESYFDAIFFSPHKFLGGPGSSGVLIFNERIYRKDLPPTTPGGGTVDYVGYFTHDFSTDIESREKGGTPPILQTIKTALVMELKDKIGTEVIEKIENNYCELFFKRFSNNSKIDIIGNKDPKLRVPIISFNIKHKNKILHPKFVTKLLNDIFGIQSRAGCSCAGPYGHTLLNIQPELSDRYRNQIKMGKMGIKPGWVRVNLHYAFTENDIKFLMDAIEYIAENGFKYIPQYSFEFSTGDWIYKGWKEKKMEISLDFDFGFEKIEQNNLHKIREDYFEEAYKFLKENLNDNDNVVYKDDEKELEELKFFYYT
ncbi:MAG: aminotransferase class V-fold PLP-dependent enzyme [Candidatus Delongbacteria bacterium]|nr:aminotransferase class V-fold PLP-dependent enzyme [Candidatus Delongbacteria bacterium]MBN2833404.1 aminotransferase class V-fold PLP-dependent enzyme [Candidatus Delongbacteria bacterium]